MILSKSGALVTVGCDDKVNVEDIKSPIHTRKHLGRVPARQGPWFSIRRKRRHHLAPPEDKVVKSGHGGSADEAPRDC